MYNSCLQLSVKPAPSLHTASSVYVMFTTVYPFVRPLAYLWTLPSLVNTETSPSFSLCSSQCVRSIVPGSSHQCWDEESNMRDTHKPFPRTFPKNSLSWSYAVFWYSSDLGSKSSRDFVDRFLSLPYTCLWNVASAICIILSLRLQGGFHRHAYDVMGNASSSASLATAFVGAGKLRRIPTSAWSKPDTRVHEADFLQNIEIQYWFTDNSYGSRITVISSPHCTFACCNFYRCKLSYTP